MESILLSVVSGVVTAAVLGIIALGWRKLHERRVKQLGDLMEIIIKHRNTGCAPVPDPAAWIQKAQELEEEAEKKATKVSTASGLLIHSLGQFPDFKVNVKVKNNEQKRFVSLLTAVIERIMETLKRHDR